MKKNLHNIDKLFKDAIDGQGETPRPAVWDAIDKGLDQNRVVDFNKRYLRLKRFALVLIAILIGAGVYTFKTWKTVNNREVVDTNLQNTVSRITPSQGNTAELTKDNAFATNNLNEAKIQQEPNTDIPLVNHRPTQSNLSEQEDIINPSAESGLETNEHLTTGKSILYAKKQVTSIQDARIGEGDKEILSLRTEIEENASAKSLAALPLIEPAFLRANDAMDLPKMTINQKQVLLPLPSKGVAGKASRAVKGSYFTATVFYAPNITVNHIKDDNPKNIPGLNVDDRDQIRKGEHFQFSTTIGVLADYHINQHWALQSGISMTTKSIHINPKTIYAGLDYNGSIKYLYNCSSGYLLLSSKANLNPVVGDSLQAFDSKNFLQYLSIPLAVKYKYPLKRLTLSLTAGGSINILFKNKIKTAVSDGQVSEVSINNKINGLQKRYFGIGISMGASYDITDKIAVSFLPSYNFAISSLTRGAAVKTYPDAIGFGAGITYKL